MSELTKFPQPMIEVSLSEPTLEQVRQIVRTEVRKALFEEDGIITIDRAEFDRLMKIARETEG
jgi:hypothetical protein